MTRAVYVFEQFTLDPQRRVLLADGAPVKLTDGVLNLLLVLVRNADRSLSKTEILRLTHDGQLRGEQVVPVQISNLRAALQKAGGGAGLIKTVGSGYQFVGSLRVVEPEAEVPADTIAPAEGGAPSVRPALKTRRAQLVAAGVAGLVLVAAGLAHYLRVAAPLAPRLSIVVEPFRFLGPDRGQAYLADAMTDDLTGNLARIPASTVIARASAEAVRGQTPQQIGRALKVRYIVEGSVTPEDGQFRVTASLVDAATAAQLWTGAFDRPSDSFVKLRVEIGHQIANALNFKLDEIESVRSMHERPNRPDAMDSFLRARSVLDRDHSLAGFEAAGALLEQALAEQPDFPEAQAELGWMLLRKVQTVHDPDEVADYRRAKTVIGQAIAASPLNTRALAARAREYQIEGDCTAAKAEVDRALALNASSLEARTVAASCAQSELRFDDAADIYGQILQLDPVSPSSRPRYLSLGLIRLIQGRPAEATLVLNRARGDEAAQPNDTGPAEQAELFLIAAAAMDGRLQQARDAFESYNRTYPHRTIWRIGALLPPAWLKINGVLTILKALGAAGMPQFDDGRASLPAGMTCSGNEFALTPDGLAGGRVLTTDDVVRALHDTVPPTIMDFGSGTDALPGAHLFQPQNGESPGDFAAQIARQASEIHVDPPLLVMGDGPTGCISYTVAQQLVSAGYTHVGWYRGGEEGWFKASQAGSGDLLRAAK